MKSNKLGVFISTIIMVLVILAVCILSVNFAKQGKEGGPLMTLASHGELRNTIEIPISEAKDISIVYSSDNLKIYPTEGERVIIKEYLSSKRDEDALATVEINDGKATITGGSRIHFATFLWISVNERIEVYLPREGIQNLELQVNSGNITAEEIKLQAETVRVASKSGNVKWVNTDAAWVKLEASSGNLKINQIVGDNITLTTKSGNISGEEICGKADVTAGSGNVTIAGFRGEGTVNAKSGNVKVETEEITGDISVETGSGNVKVQVPKDLSFMVEVNTGSGNIHTDFDSSIDYNSKKNQAIGTVGESPVGKLFLKAGSGNVGLKLQ